MKKQIKLSKEKLKKLAEALEKKKIKKISKEVRKQAVATEENKFITPDPARVIDNLNFSLPRSRSESGINFEKISPVLKPVAKAQEGLEQVASSFVLQKKSEDKSSEKPYEFGEQKYFSKSGEYKTIERIQTENLQNPTGVEKGMVHMGIEQATKRKSERFFDEEQEKKYSAEFKSLEEIKKREKKMYVAR